MKKPSLARTGPVMAVFAFLALVAAACAPPPAGPGPKLFFNSILDGNIHFDVLVPGDPNADPPTEDEVLPVDVGLSGIASGNWQDQAAGPFEVDLAISDGSFPIDVAGIGTLTVSYTVADAQGTGDFDPATGVGGFDTAFTVTVTEVDLLGPIAPPCDLTLDMSLEGQIDTNTGMLDVSQTSFDVVAPGATDCSGLGGVFGDLLGGPDNEATLSFLVGTF